MLTEVAKKEKAAKKKDYYKVMNLDKECSVSMIRKAYKILALRWHPDKNTQNEATSEIATKKFKEITEAYEVLSDPKKRQMFDQGVDPNDPESGGFSSGGGFGGNPNDIFNMFFQGGGGGSPFDSFGGQGGQQGGHSQGGSSRTFTFKFG